MAARKTHNQRKENAQFGQCDIIGMIFPLWDEQGKDVFPKEGERWRA